MNVAKVVAEAQPFYIVGGHVKLVQPSCKNSLKLSQN